MRPRTRNWYRNKAARGTLRTPTWEQLNGPLPETPHPEAEEGINKLRQREGSALNGGGHGNPTGRKVSQG